MSNKRNNRRNVQPRTSLSPSQAHHSQAREAAKALPPDAGRRRRVLSQNLLHDPRAVHTYINAVGRPNLPGIELGAGDGILTVSLADVLSHVTAVELDPVMARKLRARTEQLGNVVVLEQDVLAMPSPDEQFVLVGNIPFAITTKIVNWALSTPTLQAATLITQREYARKRTGDYGRWTLATMRTWPWWYWSLGPRIHRNSFRPRPAVDAAVLCLERRRKPLLPSSAENAWVRAVEAGFTGVGGSLRASLGQIYRQRQVDLAVGRAGVSRDEAVAFVTPAQWLLIFTDLG